jgi:hypothetical protein
MKKRTQAKAPGYKQARALSPQQELDLLRLRFMRESTALVTEMVPVLTRLEDMGRGLAGYMDRGTALTAEEALSGLKDIAAARMSLAFLRGLGGVFLGPGADRSAAVRTFDPRTDRKQ